VIALSVKSRSLLNKNVVCEDLIVGSVKEVIIAPDKWRVTHLEVGLSTEAAELVLGVKKGGIRNLLAVSAIGRIGNRITLKVKKGQLHIYLKAPKLK
jgi:sporulation protein YlmC with PRC-barrel domain